MEQEQAMDFFLQRSGSSGFLKHSSSAFSFALLNLASSGVIQMNSVIATVTNGFTMTTTGTSFTGNVTLTDWGIFENITSFEDEARFEADTNHFENDINNVGTLQIRDHLNFETDSNVETGVTFLNKIITNDIVFDGTVSGTNFYVNPIWNDESTYLYDVAQTLVFAPSIDVVRVFQTEVAVSDVGFIVPGIRVMDDFRIGHDGVGSTNEIGSFFAFTTIERAAGKVGNVTFINEYGFRSQVTASLGAFVGNLSHVWIRKVAHTGNITIQRGMAIEELINADSNIGIHSLQNDNTGNDFFIQHVGNAPSEFNGDLRFVNDNIGNSYGASDDVKTFFNSSGHYDEVQIGSVSRIFKDYVNISFESDIIIEGVITAEIYNLSNGGNITSNSSCLILASPDGTTTSNICNVGF